MADDLDLVDALLQSAEDHRLSRGERRALREVIAEAPPTPAARLALQRQLVDAVAERVSRSRDAALVRWLGDALALLASASEPVQRPSEAFFGPADPMVETLLSHLSRVARSVDLAVFTLTDDRLSDALVDLHRGGVAVRILTDGDKAGDPGSDAWRLRDRGLPLRMDESEHHFHHKFAVLDGTALVTGSYNWTRGADRHNRENFLISWEAGLVHRYAEAFEAMWAELA